MEFQQPALLLTHTDADGFGCALSVKEHCRINGLPDPEVMFLDYGMPAPDVTGRMVIITDFSFKRNVMQEICDKAKSVVLIDHHASTEKDLKGFEHPNAKIIIDTTHAASYLVWDYFLRNGNNRTPYIIRYIEDHDIWIKKLPHTEEITLFINTLDFKKDYVNAQEYLSDEWWFDNRPDMVKIGGGILKYIENETEQLLSKGIDRMNINGFDVPCINNKFNVSAIGNRISVNEPFSAQYSVRDGVLAFSLRSQPNGEDVAVIAESFGAGGHKAASGFGIPVDKVDWDEFYINGKLVLKKSDRDEK